MVSGVPDASDELNTFLLRHSDVFDELTELKVTEALPTEPNSRAAPFTPRPPTLTSTGLLRTWPASAATSAPYSSQRWTDFTLVDRAIEERFGFSIAKNHRSLKPWLKRQTN